MAWPFRVPVRVAWDMLPHCIGGACALPAGVESSHLRGARKPGNHVPRQSSISVPEFERYGGDIAFVQRRGYRREAWTYRKLARMAVACALELKERGVRTGDRVLLWGPNSAEWTAAFWGCLLRGAVAVPMDDGATLDFAGRVARDAGVRLVFSSREKAVLDTAIPRLVLEDLADTSVRASRHERSGCPMKASPTSQSLGITSRRFFLLRVQPQSRAAWF